MEILKKHEKPAGTSPYKLKGIVETWFTSWVKVKGDYTCLVNWQVWLLQVYCIAINFVLALIHLLTINSKNATTVNNEISVDKYNKLCKSPIHKETLFIVMDIQTGEQRWWAHNKKLVRIMSVPNEFAWE